MRAVQAFALFLLVAASAFAQCVTSCGVERWDIKTGCDAAATSIDLNDAIDTTIADLRTLDPPPDIRHFQGRAAGVEDQVWVVEARLKLYKSESDKDYHLVIKTGQKSMIAEIPRPSCVVSSSPFHAAIQDLRDCFETFFNHKKSKKNLNILVRVTGVGFFDIPHSTPQTGHAPNDIELHPVLGINFVDDDVQCGQVAQ
jgi:hypothetical protein